MVNRRLLDIITDNTDYDDDVVIPGIMDQRGSHEKWALNSPLYKKLQQSLEQDKADGYIHY